MEDDIMSFSFNISNWIAFKQRTNSGSDSVTPKGYTSIAFTRDIATAALACAEALLHPGLDKSLIDNLLVNGLAQNLNKHTDTASDTTPEELAQQLLPDAKDSLQGYYQDSKTNNPDFKEIIDAANAECDIEFLQLVTGLFTKEFVRQTYAQQQIT